MKSKLSLCALLACMTLTSLAQQIQVHSSGPLPQKEEYIVLDQYVAEVIYQLEYQRDSTDAENIRQEAMVLHLGHQVSRFMSHNAFKRQKAVRDLETWEDMNRLLQDPNAIRTTFNFQIFHNHPGGKITTHDRVFTDSFEYQEDLYPFSWELTGLTDSIGGYAVQQAHTCYGGREWVAWFAPELPFRAGPYKFGGLPGLILKLHDSRNHYAFTLDKITAFEIPGDIEVGKSQPITTTRESYWQTWQRFQDDAGAISREFLIDPAPGTEQRIGRNVRRRNNPIELFVD